MKENLKLKWSTKLAIFFGIYRFLGREQLRAIFKIAKDQKQYSPEGIRGWIAQRFNVYCFTPAWMSVYLLWVEKCSSENEAKDAFFTGYDYGFHDEKLKWIESPLKEAACLKWLQFITDWSDKKHREYVWNLTVGHWISRESAGAEAAMKVRIQFVRQMIDAAGTGDEASMACQFARNDNRLASLFTEAATLRDRLWREEEGWQARGREIYDARPK